MGELNKAIYPGTFDPITNGHIDIIKRSKKIFSSLIIAVAESKEKNPMFGLNERVEMIKEATKNIDGVKVEAFHNLLATFAYKKQCQIIIRGLRAVSDFEYEFQMGYANSSINNLLETIYLMPSLDNVFISSSIVRTILRHNGDISHLVPRCVIEYIKK